MHKLVVLTRGCFHKILNVIAFKLVATILDFTVSRRFNPSNAHQRPTAVILCGPHMQGAQGVNCARHLASHNVDVTVFVPNFVKVIDALEVELRLFMLTGGKKTSNVKGIDLLSFLTKAIRAV